MARNEVVVGPLPMRGWYFVPPFVAVLLAGALVVSSVRAYADESGGPSRRVKAGLANASGIFFMAAGASFVWLFVLGSSRRRRVTFRFDAGAIVVIESSGERLVTREPVADVVTVRKVPQYVDAPPRWCLAYGATNTPLAAFTTFDARELDPYANALGAALERVPPLEAGSTRTVD